MSKRGFFTFALGTAAVAAGIGLVKKKGGLHVTFDVAPSGLGESAAEWLSKREAAKTAVEEHEEAKTDEH